MKKSFVTLFIVGSILESTLGSSTQWDDSVQESTLASGATSLFRYEAKDGCFCEGAPAVICHVLDSLGAAPRGNEEPCYEPDRDGACLLESYVIVDGKKLSEERDAVESPEFSSNRYVDYLKLLSEAMTDSPDSSVP